MAKETVMAGCSSAAHAAKAARVEVISSYPIRPYTGIMMELSKLVANGELDAEFVHGEGEHAQVSIALGASASGARAYTGSSGVGVTYAMEVYSPTAGGRYPLQMAIADRALDPPGDFGSEHTDVMSARDQGWIMGWAETPQEVFDNTIMYYKIGEDPTVMLPQFCCQDGYFVSHISGEVELPDPGQVKEFLPPYKLPYALDPAQPVSHGAQIMPEQGPPPPSANALAKMLSLADGEVLEGAACWSCGVPFLVVPVADIVSLARCALDLPLWRELLANYPTQKVYPVARIDPLNWRVRMFAPGLGVAEDPATGSAAASFAGWLAHQLPDPRDGTLAVRLEQGIEMGRPSELHLEFDRAAGRMTAVRVGGAAVGVAEGTLFL